MYRKNKMKVQLNFIVKSVTKFFKMNDLILKSLNCSHYHFGLLKHGTEY